MDCLALLNSGNYAILLCRLLERKGYVFELITTPCQIAKEGCGYCIKLPAEYVGILFDVAAANNIRIREVYKIIPQFSKNKYEKIY